MKRALILAPLLLAASGIVPGFANAANAQEPAAAGPVAAYDIFPNGEIYINELVRPAGFTRVEARLRGPHMRIDATGPDGKRFVLHRYLDPLPQKNLYDFISVNRYRWTTKDFVQLGNFLTDTVNDALVNHDLSNVSQEPFPGTPLF